MRPAPLPADLYGSPFAVRAARARGVSERRLRSRDLHSPAWGVRSLRVPDSVLEHARAVRTVLPDRYAFSHDTAVALLGLPLPLGPRTASLHVMVDGAAVRPRRAGVIPHRGLESRPIVVVSGLRAVSPAATWCDLGSSWALDDLIALGDAVVGSRPERIVRLAAMVAARVRGRGVLRLRAALAEIRTGSASPMETRARLVVVRRGVREPLLNAPIHNARGRRIARGDLVWEAERVVGEYDGEQHRLDPWQYQVDLLRRRDLEDEAWHVEVFRSRDVLALPDALAARFTRILAARGPGP